MKFHNGFTNRFRFGFQKVYEPDLTEYVLQIGFYWLSLSKEVE
jgi:hypothetical protein